jgi:hypothetical protein
VSPHISWSSPGTLELFADNLHRWREGRPLHGLVDVAAGY